MTDCKHHTGYRPCKGTLPCPCEQYQGRGQQVLIVRPYHPGNIVKSTPIVEAVFQKWPDADLSWLVAAPGHELLRDPRINVIRIDDPADLAYCQQKRWDTVLSLDVDRRAVAVASTLLADSMIGYTLDGYARIGYNCSQFEYIYQLGIDNHLRFEENRKPLHELYFEMLDVPYQGQEYSVKVGIEREYVHRDSRPLVGLYVGGEMSRFSTKAWPYSHWKRLNRLLIDNGMQPVALGGESDEGIVGALALQGAERLPAGLSVGEFVASLGQFDCVVATDCFGLHAAVSQRVPVVSLHGPTPSWEAPLFGRWMQLVAECGPCYKRTAEECGKGAGCMASIRAETVLEAVKAVAHGIL